MTIYYLEYLKLKKKLRSWLGPIIVFILIMVAYPLTVEFLEKDLEKGFYSLLIGFIFSASTIWNPNLMFLNSFGWILGAFISSLTYYLLVKK